MPDYYEIRIKGHLNPGWTDWFAGLQLTHLETGETLLSGPLPDQSALHGLLERIRDLNLTLISVTSDGPSTHSSTGGWHVKTMVLSYSWSGNNEDLAASLATRLGAEHVRISEPGSRTMLTVMLDLIFNRTPKISMPVEDIEAYDLVLFVGPVWMGQIAAPFRGCFQQLRPQIKKYGFVSISGGAEGPNPKLAGELEKRLGKDPTCLIDLHIADLLPSDLEPARKDTMEYRINEREVEQLTETIMATLQKTVAARKEVNA
jgi:flavodoxin